MRYFVVLGTLLPIELSGSYESSGALKRHWQDACKNPEEKKLPHKKRKSLRLAYDLKKQMEYEKKCQERFLFASQVLGQGSWGRVYLASDQKSGEDVAVKTLEGPMDEERAGALVLEHFYLTYFTNTALGSLLTPRPIAFFYKKEHPYLVMEKAHSDLYKEMKAQWPRGFPLSYVRNFAKQIFLWLEEARERAIIHGDLKPSNLLLMEKGSHKIKIADLGLSLFLKEQEKYPYQLIQTQFYRAPEVFLQNSIDQGIDIWSVGVTLYELAFHEVLFPFRDKDQALGAMIHFLEELHPDQSLDELVEESPLKDQFFIKVASSGPYGLKDSPTSSQKSSFSRFDFLTRKSFRPILSTDTRREWELFRSFLESIFVANPEKRKRPSYFLNHPFLEELK